MFHQSYVQFVCLRLNKSDSQQAYRWGSIGKTPKEHKGNLCRYEIDEQQELEQCAVAKRNKKTKNLP